ncbi:CRTAC1 family protein [Acidobacteria bacterium AH-259-O06]|nr:CRTAC1 family protein [Acidobacteria bacterium AH-259-O06]
MKELRVQMAADEPAGPVGVMKVRQTPRGQRFRGVSPAAWKLRPLSAFFLALALFPACDLQRKATPEGKNSSTRIFREVAAQVGLGFHHFIGSTGEYFLPEITGAGVALFDYDGDGDLDIYLLQGTLVDASKQLSDTVFPPPDEHWPGNRLFRNELLPEGQLRFTDVTEQAAVGHNGYGMGAAVGDYDADGDQDLYVTNFRSNLLYRNNGDGTFADVTRRAGVDERRWSTSAAFLDYDLDGDLDLFVINYVDFSVARNKRCFEPMGGRDYCDPSVYPPVKDRLFRNDGRSRFTDVTESAGIGKAYGSGLGVSCADFNADGWIDIYVANDGNANQLWINNGDGTFEDRALMSGTAYNIDGIAESGMGVTAGDFDSDEDEDLFMANLANETNTLYLNDGQGNFHDATNSAGLANVSLPYTGFGTEWFDFDNDGRLDLFVANGAVTIIESLRGSAYPFHQRNQLFWNAGQGKFRDVSLVAGPALEISEVSRGAAFGDIDNDGDVDIILTNSNGPVRLLINEIGSRSHWLEVRLEGRESNLEGIGARVAVLREGQKPLWRRVHRDGSYLSVNDARVHFGLGDQGRLQGVVVDWPAGKTEIWTNVRPDSVATLRQGTGEPWADSRK